MLQAILCFSLLALIAPHAQAQSFSESLNAARASDPEYLQSHSGLAASQARLDQSVAATLPQISGSGSVLGNRRDYETLNSGRPSSEDRYRTQSMQLDVSQSIWRPANTAALEQSAALVSQANAQLLQAEQTLIVRLANAWFEAMTARDAALFAEYQEDALIAQVQGLARGVQLGYRDPAALEEASLRHQLAVSDLHAARNELQMKLIALELITGEPRKTPLPAISDLPADFDITRYLTASNLQEITDGNPAVVAAGFGIQAAMSEVEKQRAGHLPTIDFQGTLARNRNPAGNNPTETGFDSTTTSVGIRLNVPIYSGGGTSAKVAEAQALKDKARMEQEVTRRTVVMTLRQSWLGWNTARQRIKSTAHAVTASRVVLATVRAGHLAGTRTEADILQAQSQLAGYERDYRKSLYEQITNYLKMKAALGQLSSDDTRLIDEALHPGHKPENAPPVAKPTAS